jgi:hypothetical protein
VRASLVTRAQDWPWSSAGWVGGVTLHPSPAPRPADWLDWVNRPITQADVERLRTCTARGRPYGAEGWTAATAVRLGLDASLRTPGRPRKTDSPGPSLFAE